ncbi:TPA: hypothetical protein ACJFXU_003815 [Salmonella enterica subsp. salamae]
MTTITRERAQEIFLGNGPEPTASEQRELARIALASLEAETVAWTDAEELRDLRTVGFCEMFTVEPVSKDADMYRVIPLYTAPPAPVSVPDGLKQAVEFYEQAKQENIPVETGAWKDAVNWVLEEACRATMLQAEPVTTANKLGNSQVHSDCCQEQSPIDHGYRPECECSGCKATARICAELTGNSPVIPEGLVKAVHFYEQAKRENPPIETGVWKDAIDWVLKEACLAASTLESSREHEVISQQEKA